MFGVLRPETAEHEPPLLPQNGSPPPPMSMTAPPPGDFTSREELINYCKDWAEHQGYAVVIGRSRPNKLWIKCDRGGKYTDRHADAPENRKRKRGESRLMECPFKIQANYKKDGIWRMQTTPSEHNHGPSDDLTIHPSLRKMTDEQVQKVNEMTEAGNTPVETLDELQRLWPNIKVLRRDIYNARKKYKTEKELAEVAQGLHLPRPFQDPNGVMPGPTLTGRWEWLEEGDEIKRKKKKKLSLPAQQFLAPELRSNDSPSTSTSTHPQLSNLATRAQMYQLAENTPHPTPPQRTPTRPQPNTTPTATTTRLNGTASSISANTSPLRTRTDNNHPGPATRASQATTRSSHRNVAPNQIPTGAPAQRPPSGDSTGVVNGVQKAPPPSGQVLMNRIERMDKELMEQKNMLAQILGAVSGSGGRRG